MFVRIEGGQPDLVRARLRDGAVAALTDTRGRDEHWPYWSEAAHRLLFQARPHSGGSRPGPFDLYLWDPESHAERAVTATPRRDERWPEWSPDGSAFVYAFIGGGRGGAPGSGIALYELEGGATSTVAIAGRQDYFFRPNHHPLLRRWVAQRRIKEGRGSRLWRLGPPSGPELLVRRSGEPQPDPPLFESKPFHTRTGDEVFYARAPRAGGLRDIMRVASAGGSPRPFASLKDADDHSARPSPVRDEIAFVSTRNGTADLFLADLDSGAVRELVITDHREEYAPRWSPDGERITYTYSARAANGDRSGDQLRIESAWVGVVDRSGQTLLETRGAMPHWMPPWP